MKEERYFLVQALKEAGIKGKIHESIKSLKNSNETHLGAVLRVKEELTRSGSKRKFEDEMGQRKQRSKLFDRVTTLRVVIADSTEDKVETILENMLVKMSKGFSVDDNWIDIEITDVDWVDEDDSILKSKIAVEFDVVLKGGIYVDVDLVNVKIGSVEVVEERY